MVMSVSDGGYCMKNDEQLQIRLERKICIYLFVQYLINIKDDAVIREQISNH